MPPVEVVSYRLSHRGKPVGSQTIKTADLGRHAQLEVRSQFQGGFGVGTVVQRSRCFDGGVSLRFNEETQDRSESRKFDVVFDTRQGLITASKGSKDSAQIPYLLPYRDPVSLLHEIRKLGVLEAPYRVPMLGKEVTVQFVGEVELETVLGRRPAYAYVLHPGQSVIYVDVKEPRTILKLTQRLPDGQLDALLVKVATEASMDPFGDQVEQKPKSSKSGRRRGQRRRPRRRKRAPAG